MALAYKLDNIVVGATGAFSANIIETETGNIIAAVEIPNHYRHKTQLMFVNTTAKHRFNAHLKVSDTTFMEFITSELNEKVATL